MWGLSSSLTCRGLVVESGPTEQVLDNPQDPYTVKLIESLPRSGPGWLAPSEAPFACSAALLLTDQLRWAGSRRPPEWDEISALATHGEESANEDKYRTGAHD